MSTQEIAMPEIPHAAGAECKSCWSRDVTIFYHKEAVPVNSCILFDDQAAARRYPTGQLSLGFCRRCGFIGNVAFNPQLARYTSAYEEQQSFSARFNTFAHDLAQRWIDRYDLRNKTVLEIGCGKGDFLILLCERGCNRGVGIDPSYVSERHHRPQSVGQVTFIQDFYSQRYAHLKADVVCCRHTLEHIPTPADFMRMVREAIGNQPNTVVLFELPDVVRVLKECAFWDIYYEHCSYFSLGSLARLFRATGFNVLHLAKEYDDQYLILEAKPSNSTDGAPLVEEEDFKELSDAVARFERNIENSVRHWQRKIEGLRGEGKRAAIWGSGSKCVAFLTTLGIRDEIEVVVDINPYRQGKYLPSSGKAIVDPAHLREYRPDLVIAMNPIYLEEIRNELASMDLDPELVAV